MPAILIVILSAFASSLVARLLLGAGLAFLLIIDRWLSLRYTTTNFTTIQRITLRHFRIGFNYENPKRLSVVVSALGVAAFIKTSKVFLGVGQ
jgi:hypothetical protein